MEINTQKYDPQKIERLKQFLEKQAAKGQARYYEIYVDNLKAVPRTTDITDFDSYTEFLDEQTEKIKVKIYSTSPTSAHHDLHVFIMHVAEQAKEQGLSGIEIKSEINKEVSLARERWEAEQVKKELGETQKQLEQAEQYIEKLEGKLEEASSKRKLGDVQWGEVASIALEGVMRRNAHLLAAIPGAEGLAGVIQQDTLQKMNAAASESQAETETSFKKKEQRPELSEQQQEYLRFLEQLEERFEPQEMQQVMHILNSLAADAALIEPVAALLEKQPQQTTMKEEVTPQM
ncbi:MAG: hypothetical protein EWV91_07030 [Microcystis aeruginosa Ma_QC_Ca_00000000_S207]|uniref:Uncharacterized protein n=1 Tax=Microcystis aeruginosa Ma_QC_Ca_00000000_S207 TaxID=2486251 RepID=A0A552FT70_MICAE|nr:MAG: hypothetical protein EWV91_07030 [Microcystis aeruginosa Ma_QC_Ca_00000000_S207]